ncbi:hypothetical protein CLOM_g20132 [Closterium sp. NIES-68]|nr:hypothetical protein CLOM_g20132 [Closterium sp. NIES-68]GJP68106.1 hypothetical protein CLOP_g24852 [Closterium sp. NIES-67]
MSSTLASDVGGREGDSASDDDASERAGGSRCLDLQRIGMRIGNRVILDDVSLHVDSREIVGLLGPNGAGKSTTFSIAVGRKTPTAGTVRLAGADVTGVPLERRARLGVAFLPQEASIFRGLSVADNIRLVLEEGPLPAHLHGARMEELLHKFDLVHVAGTLGRHLSGGERRRAEVARALAVKDSDCNPPRLLMVDEPFAGVDPIGVQHMQAMLRGLREQEGMAVLITDHNVGETLGVCDRAYVMHEGRVVACGTPKEVLANPAVQRFYLGPAFPRQAVL